MLSREYHVVDDCFLSSSCKSITRVSPTRMAIPVGTKVCDRLFSADPVQLETLSESFKSAIRGGSANPKALKHVHVSGLAAVKMLMHSKRGIDEGIASEQGKPVEVMGVLFGYRDTSSPETIIVMDAFPVKCKGGPHSAVMDPDTASYMAALGETLETTRPNGKICGWYHSHPFEPLPEKHHCWFSATDVQNQNQWQIMTERHGDPFIGIVVDPQTSLQKRKIYMSAFRNFPQGYKSPQTDMCPDGKIVLDDNMRRMRWGAAWRSYYELDISLFTSSTNAKLLSVLSQKYLWISELSQNDANEPQHRARFPARVKMVCEQCSQAIRDVRQSGQLRLSGTENTSLLLEEPNWDECVPRHGPRSVSLNSLQRTPPLNLMTLSSDPTSAPEVPAAAPGGIAVGMKGGVPASAKYEGKHRQSRRESSKHSAICKAADMGGALGAAMCSNLAVQLSKGVVFHSS
jgi:COP9 signalosome complex subunit 5